MSAYSELRTACRAAVTAFTAWCDSFTGDRGYAVDDGSYNVFCTKMQVLRSAVEAVRKKPDDLGWCYGFKHYGKHAGPRHYHRAGGSTLCGHMPRVALAQVLPQPVDSHLRHCRHCRSYLTWERG